MKMDFFFSFSHVILKSIIEIFPCVMSKLLLRKRGKVDVSSGVVRIAIADSW